MPVGSVIQHASVGIEWHLNKSVTYGFYRNGEPWCVDPGGLAIEKTRHYDERGIWVDGPVGTDTATSGTNGYRHGTLLNAHLRDPVGNNGTVWVRVDGKTKLAGGVSLGHLGESFSAGSPLSLTAGDCLTTATSQGWGNASSWTDNPDCGSGAWHTKFSPPASQLCDVVYVRNVSFLFVLASNPGDTSNTLRPSYVGDSRYRGESFVTSDIDVTKIDNLGITWAGITEDQGGNASFFKYHQAYLDSLGAIDIASKIWTYVEDPWWWPGSLVTERNQCASQQQFGYWRDRTNALSQILAVALCSDINAVDRLNVLTRIVEMGNDCNMLGECVLKKQGGVFGGALKGRQTGQSWLKILPLFAGWITNRSAQFDGTWFEGNFDFNQLYPAGQVGAIYRGNSVLFTGTGVNCWPGPNSHVASDPAVTPKSIHPDSLPASGYCPERRVTIGVDSYGWSNSDNGSMAVQIAGNGNPQTGSPVARSWDPWFDTADANRAVMWRQEGHQDEPYFEHEHFHPSEWNKCFPQRHWDDSCVAHSPGGGWIRDDYRRKVPEAYSVSAVIITKCGLRTAYGWDYILGYAERINGTDSLDTGYGMPILSNAPTRESLGLTATNVTGQTMPYNDGSIDGLIHVLWGGQDLRCTGGSSTNASLPSSGLFPDGCKYTSPTMYKLFNDHYTSPWGGGGQPTETSFTYRGWTIRMTGDLTRGVHFGYGAWDETDGDGFVLGCPWIRDGIEVVSITPGPAPAVDPADDRNGMVINPLVDISLQHGIDGRQANYNRDFNDGVTTGGAVDFPKVMTTGQSWMLSISTTEGSVDKVIKYLVITGVASAPTAGPSFWEFRPGYAGLNKRSFTTNDINVGLIKNEVDPGGTNYLNSATPGYTYGERLRQPWYLHGRLQVSRQLGATEYQGTSAEITNSVLGEAALLCALNVANKTNLMYGMIQLGIDMHAVDELSDVATDKIPGEMLNKFPVIFAGTLLEDNAMKTGAGARYARYLHDMHTYTPPGTSPTPSNCNGDPTWPPGDPTGGDCSPVTVGQTWTGANVGWRNNDDVQAQHVNKEHEHVHPTEWGTDGTEGLGGDGWGYENNRREWSRHSMAYILAARMYGMEADWNHQNLFTYVDRWMNEDTGDANAATVLGYWPAAGSIEPAAASTSSQFATNVWGAYGEEGVFRCEATLGVDADFTVNMERESDLSATLVCDVDFMCRPFVHQAGAPGAVIEADITSRDTPTAARIDTDDLSFDPDFFFSTYCGADGAEDGTAQGQFNLGAGHGPANLNGGVGAAAHHNTTNHNCRRVYKEGLSCHAAGYGNHGGSSIISGDTGGAGTDIEHDWTGFDMYSNNDGRVRTMYLGGGIQVAQGSFQLNATLDAAAPDQDCGFDPDIVFFSSSVTSTIKARGDAADNNMIMDHGFWNGRTGQAYLMACHKVNNFYNPGTLISDQYVMQKINNSGASSTIFTLDAAAEISAITNGFRCTTRVVGGNSSYIGWTALKLPAGANLYTGLFSVPGDTGSFSKRDIGFRPKAIIIPFTRQAARNSPTLQGQLGFSLVTETKQYSTSASQNHANNGTTYDSKCHAHTKLLYYPRGTYGNAARIDADLTQFEIDGFTANMVQADGAWDVPIIVFGDGVAAGGGYDRYFDAKIRVEADFTVGCGVDRNLRVEL